MKAPRGFGRRGFPRPLAVVSLAAFVAMAIGVSSFLAQEVRRREEADAVAHARLLVDAVLVPLLTPTDLTGPITGERYRELSVQILQTLSIGWAARVKIWRPDGTILFSDQLQLVGRVFPGRRETLQEVLTHGVQSGASDLDDPEHGYEQGLGDKLFETYLPLRLEPGGPALAVAEVYGDYAHVEREVRRMFRSVLLALSVGLALMFLAILPVALRPLRRQNDRLREAEAKYRGLVETVPAVTYVDLADENNTAIYVSPQLEALLGVPRDEFIRRDLWEGHIHPEDRERAVEGTRRGIAGGEPFALEYRMVTTEGRAIWVRDQAAVLRDREGRPAFVQGVFIDITEQKRAEEQLREAEEKYRTLVEQIPAVTYIDTVREGDPVDLVPTYISPQIQDLLGYAPGEWLADEDSWVRCVHPDDANIVSALGDRAQTSGTPYHAEYRMVAKDGHTVWISEAAAPVRDTDGQLRRWQGVMFDLTHVKRAEEQLRETEEKYRTLVEQIPAVTYVDLPDDMMTPVYVSPQVESILGLSQAEYIADPQLWHKHLHPDDRPIIDEYLRNLALGEPFTSEYRIVRPDGRVVWIRDDTVVVRDETGRRAFVQGVMLDITQQKLAQERLQEAETKYRTLVENIPAVIYIDPLHGEPAASLYVSPQTASVFGFSQEEWLTDPGLWLRHIHPDDRERALSESNRSDETGESYRTEYRLVAEDGREVWVHDEAVLIRAQNGRPLFWQGFMLDITPRKLAESQVQEYAAALEATNEELEAQRAELVAALEELRRTEAQRRTLLGRTVAAAENERKRLAMELHDGPIQHLTALDYRLERVRLAMEGDGPGDLVRRTQETLRAEITDLRHMMSELRPPLLDERGLEAALRDRAEALQNESRIEIVLESRLPARLDPSLETILYRVTQEALTNIVKHANAAHAWVNLWRENGSIGLEIRDDGSGIDPGLVSERVAEGHIGLMAMQERVETAGGTWAIGSRPEGGTRIRAVIPDPTPASSPASASLVREDA